MATVPCNHVVCPIHFAILWEHSFCHAFHPLCRGAPPRRVHPHLCPPTRTSRVEPLNGVVSYEYQLS